MNDTIVAVSTALGVGAISIIRVSGKEAIKIVNSVFSNDLKKKASHTITYGYIKANKEVIDEVLITIMKAPKSFTCEDIIEINCHGGVATTKKILDLLLKKGCRLAEPGEFTKRAFLNGRIDLSQAEAIMDLVNVKSEQARKIAINNLKGNTTNTIKKLRSKLLSILTNIEVNIDYPEYLDIEVVTKNQIQKELLNINKELNIIITNSKNSKLIKNGINIAIIGRPNVGKSSILNKFLGINKAIVTDIPGTTRDIVEGSIILDDITCNFIDTAGIRETDDIVEKIGVDKSKEVQEEADLVIFVLDNNQNLTKEDQELIHSLDKNKSIIVINKSDLTKKMDSKKIDFPNVIYSNTIDDSGLNSLKNKIKMMFNLDKINPLDFNYVSNAGLLKKLEEAKENLKDLESSLHNDLPVDMLEIDIKNVWLLLGEIIGETYTEELLDQLFLDFCIGK